MMSPGFSSYVHTFMTVTQIVNCIKKKVFKSLKLNLVNSVETLHHFSWIISQLDCTV